MKIDENSRLFTLFAISMLLTFFCIILLLSVLSFLSLAPFVPTRSSDLERIAKILDLKKWEKFLEIGAGTAKVSLFLGKRFPESQITGIELSPFFYILAKVRVWFFGTKNVDILFGDALKKDLWIYDVLYVFGLPETISRKLAPKLLREMKTHSRFFSYCFEMTSSDFLQKKHKESPEILAIYEYTKK